MKLITSIDIPKGVNIYYGDSIVSIGSCFAEHIGMKLSSGKFQVSSNPFGILYNPISIATALKRIVDNQHLEIEDLFQHQGLWHSWMHHGMYSNTESKIVLSRINTDIQNAHTQLKKAKILIITLGSAFIYTLKESQQVVANCHKIPSSKFIKSRLTVDQVSSALNGVLDQVKAINPEVHIIMTVSPIRHIRDGIIENQRSKAVLLLATEQISKRANVSYFPSYEILMDELRDYRFYNSDMVHPSSVAIDYVWERFKEGHFDTLTTSNYNQVLKVAKGFQHRILHPNTTEHHKFLQTQIAKAEGLMEELAIDFSSEINSFKGQLELFKD